MFEKWFTGAKKEDRGPPPEGGAEIIPFSKRLVNRNRRRLDQIQKTQLADVRRLLVSLGLTPTEKLTILALCCIHDLTEQKLLSYEEQFRHLRSRVMLEGEENLPVYETFRLRMERINIKLPIFSWTKGYPP